METLSSRYLPLIGQRVRGHADRGCADEEGDQINEVTGFADDPSAADGFGS